MKKYIPIGEQHLLNIINNNFLYIDKTKQIINLINTGRFKFLSRPRRWGKSLLVDTMKELFLGNKELFKDTYAYNNWDWSQDYPVIVAKFDNYKNDYFGNMNDFFKKALKIYYKDKQYFLNDFIDDSKFLGIDDLVFNIYQKTGKQVVVLFDEYDKPLNTYLDNPEKFNQMKEIYTSFFTGIKSNEEYFRFFYLSGLTKVAQTSLFSTLNNLYDITFDADSYDLLGYTEDEIKYYFEDYILETCDKFNFSKEDLFYHLKDYYDGYFFGSDDIKLYNPWSINSFFKNKRFEYYWASTGIHSILEKTSSKIQKEETIDFITNIDKGICKIDKNDLKIDEPNETFLNIFKKTLLLSGYLTYTNGYIDTIRIANKETRYALFNLLMYLSDVKKENISFLKDKNFELIDGLINIDKKKITSSLKEIFSLIDIKTKWKEKNPEGVFKSFFSFLLTLGGIKHYSENNTTGGFIDMAFDINNKMYILEFKYDGSADDAINQIDNQYMNFATNQSGYKVGINMQKNSNSFDVKIVSF